MNEFYNGGFRPELKVSMLKEAFQCEKNMLYIYVVLLYKVGSECELNPWPDSSVG